MGLENLAFNSGRTGSSFTPTEWAVFAVGVIGSLVVVAAVLFLAFRVFRATSPKFKGPALAGTAQILQWKTTGLQVGSGSMGMKTMCQFELRVQIPGHQAYDVTMRQAFLPWLLHSELQPGTTVAVEVDSANPQNVRIVPVESSGQATPSTRVSANVVRSGADLLASGQRVSGVLKSYAATGTTPRNRGMTNFSIPELIDAPFYNLVIELHLPNLAPVESRIMQPVPPTEVPNLAIGLQLPCAVDPANPKLCAVDWDAITH